MLTMLTMLNQIFIDKSSYYIIKTITLWNLYRVGKKQLNKMIEIDPSYNSLLLNYAFDSVMIFWVGTYTLKLSYMQ